MRLRRVLLCMLVSLFAHIPAVQAQDGWQFEGSNTCHSAAAVEDFQTQLQICNAACAFRQPDYAPCEAYGTQWNYGDIVCHVANSLYPSGIQFTAMAIPCEVPAPDSPETQIADLFQLFYLFLGAGAAIWAFKAFVLRPLWSNT